MVWVWRILVVEEKAAEFFKKFQSEFPVQYVNAYLSKRQYNAKDYQSRYSNLVV